MEQAQKAVNQLGNVNYHYRRLESGARIFEMGWQYVWKDAGHGITGRAGMEMSKGVMRTGMLVRPSGEG